MKRHELLATAVEVAAARCWKPLLSAPRLAQSHISGLLNIFEIIETLLTPLFDNDSGLVNSRYYDVRKFEMSRNFECTFVLLMIDILTELLLEK